MTFGNEDHGVEAGGLSALQAQAGEQLPNTHASRRAWPLMVAHLSGTQEQMGAQHGSISRAVGDWGPVLDFYPRMPELMLSGGSKAMARVLRPLVEAYVTRLERARPAELRGRTRAFMRALGISPRMSRWLLVMDTLQNIVNTAGRHRLGPFARRLGEGVPPMCSTLVAWGAASEGGALRHARNFDFPGVGVWEQRPAVVFCTPRRGLRYGFVTLRGGDVPGVSSFNEAGLTVTTHTRFHREFAWDGIGVIDLVHQIVREARTLAEAERIIRSRTIASSWGLCVSSAEDGQARVFDVAGDRVGVVEPGADEPFIVATNRYVHPDLRDGEVTISPAFVRNSNGRYDLLRAKARAALDSGGLSLETMQALLGCQEDLETGLLRAAGSVPAQLLSVHSIVVEPEEACVHVSVGPAPTGLGPWVRVPWVWRDAPGFAMHRYDTLTDAMPVHTNDRFSHGPAAKGLTALVEATAHHGGGGDLPTTLRLLEEAVEHDPEAPSHRIMAGGARLKQGDVSAAQAHFAAGLEHESNAFYRGQLLLWAARVARLSNDTVAAERYVRELLDLDEPLLAEHKHAARAERGTPKTLKQLTKLRLNMHLAELNL